MIDVSRDNTFGSAGEEQRATGRTTSQIEYLPDGLRGVAGLTQRVGRVTGAHDGIIPSGKIVADDIEVIANDHTEGGHQPTLVFNNQSNRYKFFEQVLAQSELGLLTSHWIIKHQHPHCVSCRLAQTPCVPVAQRRNGDIEQLLTDFGNLSDVVFGEANFP